MLKQNKSLKKFCQSFDAHVEPSERRFARSKRLDYTDLKDPNVYYTTETINSVAIHIPEDRIDDFISIVDEHKYIEMEIRNSVPAVKLAYERYQLLLKMCGGEYYARY